MTNTDPTLSPGEYRIDTDAVRDNQRKLLARFQRLGLGDQARDDRDLSADAKIVMLTITSAEPEVTPARVILALPGSDPDDIWVALEELAISGYVTSYAGVDEPIHTSHGMARTPSVIAGRIDELGNELTAKSEALRAHAIKAARRKLSSLGDVIPVCVEPGKIAAKYRDPVTGATWAGRGKTPRWIASGNRDDYLIRA